MSALFIGFSFFQADSSLQVSLRFLADRIVLISLGPSKCHLLRFSVDFNLHNLGSAGKLF
jgi:hypothetical protein